MPYDFVLNNIVKRMGRKAILSKANCKNKDMEQAYFQKVDSNWTPFLSNSIA
jgi:hypothetical protein